LFSIISVCKAWLFFCIGKRTGKTGVMKKISVKNIWKVLVKSFKGFGDDKITKLSASLAYSTVFSLGPLLIVIIFLCGIFFGQQAVQGTIYNQMQDFVGKDAALQLQTIIENAAISGKGKIAAIIGIVTLILGATAVFAEIQDSINTIWGIKPKPKKGWLKIIINRALSFSMIVSLGFLLLVSLAVSTVIEGLSKRLQEVLPHVTVVVFYLINLIISFAVISMLFAVIFKILPDAKIKWKDVMPGAIASAVLFMIGKFGISFYISQSNVGTTYGAAGSLVILLLWVYYSSIILYFGAEFTKAYAVNYGGKIYPSEYAVALKQVEVEEGKQSIQENKKELKI
jgi:membrane protein